MKILFPTALVFALTATLLSQEPIPAEKARDIAKKVLASLGRIEDAPFIVEADAEKPQAFSRDKVAILVLPDQRLTATTLAEAGQTAVPVGQLWLLNAAVATAGQQAAPKAQLRTVVVEDGDKERDVQLYLLGAKKNDQGNLDLLVFGKGLEPLIRVPIEKTAETTQAMPLQIAGRKGSDTTGILTILLFGQHKAEMTVVKPAE